MRYLWFGSALLLSVVILYVSFFSLPIESAPPPLGSLLNPFSGVMANAESKSDYRDYTLTTDDIGGEIKILLDDNAVPHIYTDDDVDAYYAQGYMHAKQRLWQMDMTYRAIAGRLSEVLGERTIDYDISQRKMGYDHAVELRLKSWEGCPRTQKVIDSYCAGVNAYIKKLRHKNLPIEYKLMEFRPEKWSPEKTAYVFMSMCKDLVHGDYDIEYSNIRSALGDQTFEMLFPDHYTRQQPIVPIHGPSTQQDKNAIPYLSDTKPIRTPDLPEKNTDKGSNNWAINSTKTADGSTILANDPHLTLRLPSVWHQIHIQTDSTDVQGVTIPGIPSVIIGYNNHAAWGVTNVSHDFSDWYIIDWAEADKSSYFRDGQTEKTTYRKQTVKVKGRPDTTFSQPYTSLGPVYSPGTGQDYTFHWLLFEDIENCDLNTFLNLDQSASFSDYYEASSHFKFPPQNMIFANEKDEIAIRVQGLIPIKNPGQGKTVQDMSSATHEWNQFIPQDELPMLYNPDRGFVFSANQQSTTSNYPYYYTGRFEGFRSREIYDYLSTHNGMTIDDMKSLQLDNHNLKAADVCPLFIEYLSSSTLSPEQEKAVNSLKQWDYNYTAESEDATLFEIWFWKAFYDTFNDEFLPIEKQGSIVYPQDWRFTELVLDYPDYEIFDDKNTSVVETSPDIIRRSFQQAFEEFEELSDRDKQWAYYNNVDINHLASIPAFSRLDLFVNGSGDSPNAVSGSLGPSWRMIVKMGPEPQALGIYPGGQSGNPGSKYYDNMIDQWIQGDYNKLYLYNDDELEPSSIQTITINAKGN